MQRIDAHIHYYGDHADNQALLAEFDLKLFNICVAGEEPGAWRWQNDKAAALADRFPDRYAWCTSFDLPDFSVDYTERVIAGLQQDIKAGAIACKIWKNVGMEVRRPDGDFLLVDDPLFEPILTFLEREGLTLLMHIGEPLACWRPLVDDNPHYGYYSKNPQWHMYGRDEYPSHGELVQARDNLVQRHPDLRCVGAHLASLEYDVAEVAQRLEAFPNFAVDTSARMPDLSYQNPDTVRQFFAAFSDRLLFGTDLVQRDSTSKLDENERRSQLEITRARFEMEFAYFENEGLVTVRDRSVEGLALQHNLLEKFYHTNARRWYPGL
jgi:predicted TIM-barrel fold metal-dependent hydrolase